MRVGRFTLERCDQVVLFWIASDEHRALVPRSWDGALTSFDGALRLVPGARAAAPPEVVQRSLVCLAEPAEPIVVRPRAVDEVVGLVRPLVAGNIAGRELVLAAAVERGAPRLPLLGEPAAVSAVTSELDNRVGRAMPWRTFTVERRGLAGSALERVLRERRNAGSRGRTRATNPAR